MGAPFSQETAAILCEDLAGGLSLRASCRKLDLSHVTVLGWLQDEDKAAFADQYARARAQGYALLAEDILEISDDELDDGPVAVARAKLRVDSRKWILSKMLPKVYGDKLALGGDADNPLTVTVQRLTDRAA